MRDRSTVWIALACALTFGACKGRSGQAAEVSPEAQDAAPRVPFEVRADAADFVFFWFDERGSAHAVSRASEVPEARRAVVRVDPPRPEQRAAGWVYVVDLRAPAPGGAFPAHAIRSEELSRQVLAMAGVQGSLGTQPPAPPGAAAQPSTASVIIYGASWCHACHEAATWLRGRNVPFVEKDIERDPGAQEEMVAKAQRAGVPTGSIPIIDVRGRVMVGFSPPELERALAGG